MTEQTNDTEDESADEPDGRVLGAFDPETRTISIAPELTDDDAEDDGEGSGQ